MCAIYLVFPKLHKVGNVANKGLHRKSKINPAKEIASSGDRTQDLLVL